VSTGRDSLRHIAEDQFRIAAQITNGWIDLGQCNSHLPQLIGGHLQSLPMCGARQRRISLSK
jgi:hypothetical protein